MINLENITTRGILPKESGIENYKQLYDLIDVNNELQSYMDDLIKTEYNMARANKLGKEPIIYATTQYKSLDLPEEKIKLLEDTDKKTSAINLLCLNPLSEYSTKRNKLGAFSISEIKHLLGHCVVSHDVIYGQNALIHYIRNIGEKNVEEIANAVKIYENQVFRQLQDTDNLELEHGLFYKDYYEKNLLVQYNLDEIVKFILDNNKTFIWGKMSDVQKRNLVASMNSNTTKKGIKLKTDFINMITNYTTLDDYKNDIIKEKTLQKFIIK